MHDMLTGAPASAEMACGDIFSRLPVALLVGRLLG
jgi:hypothetical protein